MRQLVLGLLAAAVFSHSAFAADAPKPDSAKAKPTGTTAAPAKPDTTTGNNTINPDDESTPD